MKNNPKHNAHQRNYYESALQKPTMQVRDTPYIRNHIEKMVQFSELGQAHNILEVGAGLGKFTIPLLKAGFQITCNDLSQVLLEKLKANTARSVNTVACDIIDIDKHTSDSFDKVIGFFTLHHMADLEAVFLSIQKILKPGAELTFIEPLARNPLYYLQIACTPKMSMKAERGILKMSDRVVHKAMHSAGLQPLKSVTYGFFPPFIVNSILGGKAENLLAQQSWLSWAHAFVIFRGVKPL
jgi:2-polyprenyl-3-methyl-5-hydroxy-6-metoxy-1,4-benzoquinol methylase